MDNINHLQFSIKCRRKLPDFNSDYELSEWIRKTALPVVEDVFSSVNTGDTQIIIDDLVIDVGDFSEQNFCSDLPSRLASSLKLALTPHIPESDPVKTGLQKKFNAFFNNIQNFSESSQLKQWHALFDDNRSTLKNMLFTKCQHKTVRNIIAQYFQQKIQSDILLLLEPSNIQFINLVLAHSSIFKFIQPDSDRTIDESPSGLHSVLVELTLNFLIVENGQQFRCKNYLLYILHKFSKLNNRSYVEYSQSIFKSNEYKKLSGTVKAELEEIFCLSQVLFKQGEITSSQQYYKNADQLQLKELFCVAIKDAKWSLLEPYWSKLTLDLKDDLRRMLQQEGQAQQIRQNISRDFPNSAFRQIIELLEPNQFKFIDKILNKSDLFYQIRTVPDNTVEFTMDSTLKHEFNEPIKEFTLTYLLIERGSHFNKKSYLRSLLRQMAGHYSIRYDDLLGNLYNVVKSASLPAELTEDFLDILDFSVETRDKGNTVTTDKLSTGYELYQNIQSTIEAALLTNTPIKVDDWKYLIQLLETKYPAQLQRFYRELQVGSKAVIKLNSVLKAESIRFCIHKFMHFTGHINSNNKSLLLAIDRYAKKSVNQLTFYRYLLFALLNNHLIDLQRLLDLSSSSMQYIMHYDELSVDVNLTTTGFKLPDWSEPQYENITPQDSLWNKLNGLIEKLAGNNDRIKADDWNQLIQQNNTNDSLLWQHFFTQLGKDTSNLDTLCEVLETDALECCIAKLIQHSRHINNQDNAFLNAITSYANKTVNRPVYYKYLLFALLHNRLVDLELILELSGSHNPSAMQYDSLLTVDDEVVENAIYTKKYQQEVKLDNISSRLEQSELPADKAFRQHINTDAEELNLLLQQPELEKDQLNIQKINQARKFQLEQLQEKLINLSSGNMPTNWLNRFLQKQLKDQHKTDLLFQLPEKFLCQLLQGIAPVIVNSVIKVAENLRLAALNPLLKLTVLELRKSHWQSLFEYILLPNNFFNLDRFVQIYFSQLNALLNERIKFDDIKQIISQQLVLNQTGMSTEKLEQLSQVIDSLSWQDVEFMQLSFSEKIIPDRAKIVPVNVAINTPQKSPRQLDKKIVKRQAIPINQDLQTTGHMFHIHNCGLVLATHYLPLLFERLELTRSGQFISHATTCKAVSLLHYLVYGNEAMSLNNGSLEKLLCGVDLNTQLNIVSDHSQAEKELIDGLLNDLINSWTAIGKTSVEGLRETFLQRDGVLMKLDETCWKLKVEASAFDMLLDRLPWSFSNIRHSFMSELIHVEWRQGGIG